MKKAQILLTNDDGIQSPGLWTAAAALSEIGFVHVVAPRDQFSGAGRSMPTTSDGIIDSRNMHVNGQDWTVYAVGGTPAQTVQHAVLEILPEKPDLVVSGINYGENMGTAVTISGTVGAALEAATHGIPALAISLETGREYHLTHSTEIDFSVAGYFTAYFGRLLLKHCLPQDVDVLKVDVPLKATVDTPWVLTRLSRRRYYVPIRPERKSFNEPVFIDYHLVEDASKHDPESDVYTLRIKRCVAVTPLSLDLTSRVNLKEIDSLLKDAAKG